MGLLAGCAALPGSRNTAPQAWPSPTPRVLDADLLQRLATDLTAAVRDHDADRFVALFAPQGRAAGSVIGRNALHLAAWQAEADADHLRVRTQAGAQTGWGSATLALAVDPEGRILWLGPRPGDHPVVWLDHLIDVSHDDPIWLIAAASQASMAPVWLRTARDASERLATLDWSVWRPPSEVAAPLTLELPADLVGFGEPIDVGAYVRLRGTDDEPRIVVSPADRPGLTQVERLHLLTHEAVHALTRSPEWAAPGWAVEGFAEQVTEQLFPDLAAAHAALLPRASEGVGLPSDADLAAGGLPVYALAARAIAGAQDRWGSAQVQRWLADWQAPRRPSEAEFTDALRAALPQ